MSILTANSSPPPVHHSIMHQHHPMVHHHTPHHTHHAHQQHVPYHHTHQQFIHHTQQQQVAKRPSNAFEMDLSEIQRGLRSMLKI